MKNTMNLDILVNHIKHNNKPISLCKQLNISNQLLTYYLRQLRLKGIIIKKGKGTWEIAKDIPKDDTKKELSQRSHAYIWKIRFLNKINNWNNRKEILNKLRINYTLVGKDKDTPRIIIKGKKIWLTNEGLIIYEPKSFFDSTPLEARKQAVYELQDIIKSIKSKLKLNIERWEFKPKREHIARIHDLMAIQCNKEGLRMQIIDKDECWMEIDNSFNQDETEFYKTRSFSPIINGTGYQNYFNSHKNTNWKVTPEFILNNFAIAQNQLTQFTQQINSHLKLIQEYRKENISWRKNQVKEIKINLKEGEQKSLLDYGN